MSPTIEVPIFDTVEAYRFGIIPFDIGSVGEFCSCDHLASSGITFGNVDACHDGCGEDEPKYEIEFEKFHVHEVTLSPIASNVNPWYCIVMGTSYAFNQLYHMSLGMDIPTTVMWGRVGIFLCRLHGAPVYTEEYRDEKCEMLLLLPGLSDREWKIISTCMMDYIGRKRLGIRMSKLREWVRALDTHREFERI